MNGLALLLSLNIFGYLSLFFMLRRRLVQSNAVQLYAPLWWMAFVVAALHGSVVGLQILTPEGWNFSLGSIFSLIGWVTEVSLLMMSLNKPMYALGLLVYPISLLGLLSSLLPWPNATVGFGVGLHAIFSLVAYSLTGLSVLQALLILLQERLLKQKRLTHPLMTLLPPLNFQDKALFEQIYIGFSFLLFAMVTGVFFVEDLLAQHLVHKTFFALVALVMYLILIGGRIRFGWRGKLAAKWTVYAYVPLFISYIGTQVILDFIIKSNP